MNESHDNQLDRLLRDWARSSGVSADSLALLQTQIQERMATERLSPAQVEPLAPGSTPRNWRFAAALGMAAAVLVALAGWWGYLRSDGPQSEIAHTVGQPLIPAAPALADRTRLLREYQEVFGPQLAWLVEQPGRAEIGLWSSDPQRAAGPSEFVAVRLMLFARPASEDQWKEVQTLDVIARREELVEVTSKAENGAALAMWAYPLDEEMISIDLRYEPSKFAGHSGVPRGLSIESSSVQSVGESVPVYSFERDGVEYRLYQSVDLLPSRDVG